PMNCPYHILIYKSGLRSYRELPMRMAELGAVYRYEASGVLHGLLRVRGFTIDDAHIFCSPDQVEEEIRKAMDFSLDLLRGFGFKDFKIELSVRDPRTPEQYAGSNEDWEMAEAALARALDSQDLPYEPMPGEAVFYGPKIDIKIKDALGRLWQASTIQFDFNMPARFEMEFVDKNGERRQPFMVHRALLGSLERFFGVLIEHYAGAFPVWLSPVQAVVIPIADRHADYARVVAGRLKEAGLRVSIDDRSERMQAKIRDAQLQKIPYMLVVGDQEVEQGNVSVRLRTEEDLGPQPLEDLIARAQEAIAEKRDF
ncbi:MAG: threonine--tRNA ligase, partial [Anaerolineae bacterium]